MGGRQVKHSPFLYYNVGPKHSKYQEINAFCNNFFHKKHTVEGNYINAMKTTFDLNFDLYQAVKQHGYTKTKQKTSR